MTSICDSLTYPTYPWHEARAQQLHMKLVQIHPTAQAASMMAQKAGIFAGVINTVQAPTYVWMDVLNEATVQGVLCTLIEKVLELLNVNSPYRPFLEDIFADKPLQAEPEPRSQDGAPKFLKDDDAISEPEALLYFDDLTIQIGRVPGLITTLQRLVELAPAVCKLAVDINGLSQSGTGFRIGQDTLLSNWHVLHNKNDGTGATTVSAEFGYEDDGKGGVLGATVIACDVTSIVTDKADDWAIIRTSQPLLVKWPVVKLSEAAAPTLNTAAYIVQHPGGQRKRLGFVRNQVSAFDDRVVHYLTDTQEGSSGAPVFDAQGKLIALHHAGGRPQEVAGRAPLKKNEGIRISRIVAGLTGKGVVFP